MRGLLPDVLRFAFTHHPVDSIDSDQSCARYNVISQLKPLDQQQLSTNSLLVFREEFPILEKTTYLVSNSLGPMPRTVPAKLAEYARDWGDLGVKAWARGWREMPIEVGNEIAPLMNAEPGEVVMMPNVSIAQSAVA